MVEIKGKKFEIDDDLMIFSESDMAEYITVWENDVPTWYKMAHDNKGDYITLNGEKYYVLVDINE